MEEELLYEIFNRMPYDVQYLIEKWYHKIILHDRLRKAQQHLQDHFVRHSLEIRFMSGINFDEMSWKVGDGKSIIRHGQGSPSSPFGVLSSVCFVHVNISKIPSYVQWTDHYMHVQDLKRDELELLMGER